MVPIYAPSNSGNGNGNRLERGRAIARSPLMRGFGRPRSKCFWRTTVPTRDDCMARFRWVFLTPRTRTQLYLGLVLQRYVIWNKKNKLQQFLAITRTRPKYSRINPIGLFSTVQLESLLYRFTQNKLMILLFFLVYIYVYMYMYICIFTYVYMQCGCGIAKQKQPQQFLKCSLSLQKTLF